MKLLYKNSFFHATRKMHKSFQNFKKKYKKRFFRNQQTVTKRRIT